MRLETTLQELEELAISVKEYDELLVLNYSQIDSPKDHPLVIQCRGLIVDKEFNIVSRGFDRFFNYGELSTDCPAPITAYTKVDGSLIKIYYWNEGWYVSTRGTAFAECPVGDRTFSFRDLVLKSLYAEDVSVFNHLDKEYTHIFELTSRYNRIVTDHGPEPTLWYLASRHTAKGHYNNMSTEVLKALGRRCRMAMSYGFSNVDQLVTETAKLEQLQEGYVIYHGGAPIYKVKNPTYVAAHRLRSNGLTVKNMVNLMLTGELTEYLTYFPEDGHLFDLMLDTINNYLLYLDSVLWEVMILPTRKEQALAIKDIHFNSLIFKALDLGIEDIFEVYNQMELNKKQRYVMSVLEFYQFTI